MKRGLVRWGVAVTAAPCLLTLALYLSSFMVSIPPALTEGPASGTRIEDRDGRLLARTTSVEGTFAETLKLDQTGPHLAGAMIAAEDKRFRHHLGVDPLAIIRASFQALTHGRIVSGASTISQQLARSYFERPRTLFGKWKEMSLALRIERTLSKDEILESYLNSVHFGPNIVGARAAADHYFGKPISALSLSETAALAGFVRGPTLYDPRRRPELARKRRDRVLKRMQAADFISPEEAKRAQSVAVEVHPRPPLPGALHWVRVVARERKGQRIHATLHGNLQGQVQNIVAQHRRRLDAESAKATAAAAVVLDNATGEVLAYVGSPDFHDKDHGGQNDGVQALRQPGSTLKPFIYAQAFDELGLNPTTLLPDSPTHFRTTSSYYSPRNFDRKFRGQVTVRRALANSLNVPAVHVLEKLGESRVLKKLRELGLDSLTRDASHYGPALALGDGEVSLVKLCSAYATLARGGRTLAARFYLDEPPSAQTAQAFSPVASALISEILSDDAARREAFGTHNSLDLPFPMAVKTGTSKGYRDTWTLGYTKSITIGVWVGNFDGSPTSRLTGARGAAPLFHMIAQATAQELGAQMSQRGHERPLHDIPLERRSSCTPSTEQPCPALTDEWYPVDAPKESPSLVADSPFQVDFPRDGMSFLFDSSLDDEQQSILLKGRGPESEELSYVLDGSVLSPSAHGHEWPLEKGHHRLWLESPSLGKSDEVHFTVN